jgi:peptidoglycan/xylan/chitin deacetylase (PgdA/CDA1 family)
MCGLNTLALPKDGASVLILAYHGVIPDEHAHHPHRLPIMVTVSEFRAQLLEVLRSFTAISAEDFRRWRQGRALPARHHLLVTFDDGYGNNVTHAAPILRELGVPATFFVSAGYIGKDKLLWPTEIYLRVCSWPESRLPLPRGGDIELPERQQARSRLACRLEEICKRIPGEQRHAYLNVLRKHSLQPLSAAEEAMFAFMSWDDLRALSKAGFTVGSHTVEHPILSCVPYDEALYESQESKSTIERELGIECFFFAYPNGGRRDVNSLAVDAVRRAGYEVAFTMMGSPCRLSSYAMLCDRVWVPGGIGMRDFRTRISGVHAAVQRLVGLA